MSITIQILGGLRMYYLLVIPVVYTVAVGYVFAAFFRKQPSQKYLVILLKRFLFNLPAIAFVLVLMLGFNLSLGICLYCLGCCFFNLFVPDFLEKNFKKYKDPIKKKTLLILQHVFGFLGLVFLELHFFYLNTASFKFIEDESNLWFVFDILWIGFEAVSFILRDIRGVMINEDD